ncbi:hypothetical protein T440DRAFT_473805 [Plenodomus tracheiphilus IPT5]|uniref:Aldoxime dehydratase n=1 Tax=Plenodomus tracheiphilus IPT5 TaxID=1408161 RepID=A0A6A7ANR3_9PLEO|nr:hypothetical protein T440DRAFT_473805 [Plenodomus tracheiphilus IPT5]
MPCALIPQEHPFALVLFGCQYFGSSPSPDREKSIRVFDAILKQSAAHTETLEHDLSPQHLGSSRVWMSYWKSPDDYRDWWNSAAVTQFWSALQDDAGFWREKLTLHSARSMFATNKHVQNGYSHLGSLAPISKDKAGYWGSYRDRLEEATPQNRLESSLQSVADPKALTGSVRQGRVVMNSFPENLCLAVEGQDYSNMQSAEREYWKENFDQLARRWVSHATNAGPKAGVVSARHCFAAQSGKFDEDATDAAGGEWAPAFNFNRQVEIFYFLDLSHFERIGKTVKVHIDLRNKFMKSCSPGGPMEKNNMLLWVELSVVKAQDIEAEYIGCYDGTGFMAYDDVPAFQSH